MGEHHRLLLLGLCRLILAQPSNISVKLFTLFCIFCRDSGSEICLS